MRIGIDLGGTKIEGILMADDSRIIKRVRIPTPANDYEGQISAIASIVSALELDSGSSRLPVGLGHPGAVSPATGKIKNANSICLNGRALREDLAAAIGREIRMANDADCLAVSEQADGAAAGAANAFAVILGTGVGGGAIINGRLLSGPNGIAGEWGHNPLPWADPEWDEVPGPLHWDERHGAIEAWLSGPGMSADHMRRSGESMTAAEITAGAAMGAADCEVTLQRYEHRLARALATVINVLDPEVIVLGGGLSHIKRLYQNVPAIWGQWIFSDTVTTDLRPALHGDSSGVRGAAWLWPA